MMRLLQILFACLIVGGTAQAATQRATVEPSVHFRSAQEGVLSVVLDIKPGFHAQSHTPTEPQYIKLIVTPTENPNVTFHPAIYPPGKDEEYPSLGKLNVYTDRVTIDVPFTVKAGVAPDSLTLGGRITYQICDNKSCFMPESPTFTVSAAGASSSVSASSGSSGSSLPAAAQWSLPAAFGIAFVAGMLFNVMPCVLPVLPIKAMGFYEVSQHKRSRCFALGLLFGLGIIAVFTILAMLLLGLRWIQWGELFQKPWFIWAVVVMLIGLAMSLFGLYTFSLPIGTYRFEPRHDTYTGNFLMGGFTAILATPCTAPLLPGLLLWAVAQPATIGVPAMIMVGVGMAFPYLILSAFPELARKFPRTGPWSELFKQMMGFLLLAAAAYFAGGRLIHGPAFWWAPTTAIAIAAIYLIARTIQLSPKPRPILISAIIATLLLGSSLAWTIRINGRPWEPYSAQRFDEARHSGKIVLVKFTANWCGTCQYIEGTVFQDARTWAAIKKLGVVPLKVDLTDSNAPGNDLLIKLNPAGGIPLTAIFLPGHDEPIQISSVYTTQNLLDALDQANRSIAKLE